MKSYTTYNKLHRPYFNLSEFIGFPLLPMAVIALISFVILFFLGLTAMLIANSVMAFVLTFIYLGLKSSSPNGSGRSTSLSMSALIESWLPAFLAISGIILVMNVGGYIVATYLHTGVFYSIYFYCWLFVMFVLPVSYFVIKELTYQSQLYNQARHFTPLSLNIVRDYELLTGKIRVTILNTKKKLCSEEVVGKPKDVDHVGKLGRMSVSERNECLYEPVFNETIPIPQDADRFMISWYCALEEKKYAEEIEFPFHKLVYVPNKYPLDMPQFLRGNKTDRVTLSILPGGKIQLFNKHQNLLETVSINSVVLSAEDKAEELELVSSIYPVKSLSTLINTIKQSHIIEKRAELTEYTCSWQVSGTGLEEHNIEIKDVKNSYTTSKPIALNVFEQRRFPIFFEIDYQKTVWLYIHIDAEKLYDVINNLGDKDPEVTFYFALDAEKGAANLVVKNKDRVIPFTAWEKKVDEYRLKELKDYFFKNKEHFDKNNFLKEISECIIAKDYTATAALCKKALLKYPYFPMIYFYEARLLWYNEGFESSYAKESYFIEKTKTEPHALAQIYNHYGCLYDEQNNYVESLRCFEQANAIYSDIHYLANIAESYYKLKDATKALYYAEECMNKEGTFEIITEILANKGIIKNV